LLFADELDLPLLPKTGYPWLPPGPPVEGMTPGQNEKHSWAGGWDRRSGLVHHGGGARQANQRFPDLLDTLEVRYPVNRYERISVVVDNDKIQQARPVPDGLVAPPRFALLWRPTYCPRAHPIERICGDTPDKVRRNHTRKRLRDWGADVDRHLEQNGPGPEQRSSLYPEPDVTAAMNQFTRRSRVA
jgi:hypothetical protein